MADDETTPGLEETAAPTSPPESVEPRRSFIRRHWGKLTFATVTLVPLAVFSLWAAIALSYDYSTGQRVGWVQKLSRRGYVCKTWEGELQMSNIPGSAPMLFQFTVPDDSIAHAIEQASGKKVALYYEQHIGVPTNCFGETEYFVTHFRIVEP